MRPETRRDLFDTTVDHAGLMLNLSARAVIALVEEGLLDATPPVARRGGATLDSVRLRGDQLVRLLAAPAEVAAIRQRHPRRTRDYDRALALGAALLALGRRRG